MNRQFDSRVKAIEWSDGKLRLLDQRCLPGKIEYIDYTNTRDVADAIRDMVVRGAPAIGITAAYAVVLAARTAYAKNEEAWQKAIEDDLSYLAESRPTAVNLGWAIKTMRDFFTELKGDPEERLLFEARRLHDKDIADNHLIGHYGAELINDCKAIMTHCNAGALATGGYGTALGVIRSAYGQDKIQQVYACETRPWLQGARLTAWELQEDDIPVTVISDTAASYILSRGEVGWVVVGADRIAANGDVANKIGTYQLAISARYHGLKFMVAAPLSTIDLKAGNGQDIPIEIRSAMEVSRFMDVQTTPENVSGFNPAFDVTPASLIDVIVTEKGVVQSPNQDKIQAIFSG